MNLSRTPPCPAFPANGGICTAGLYRGAAVLLAGLALLLAPSPATASVPAVTPTGANRIYPGPIIVGQSTVTVSMRDGVYPENSSASVWLTIKDTNMSWLQVGIQNERCAYLETNDVPGDTYDFRCVKYIEPGQRVVLAIMRVGRRTYEARIDRQPVARMMFTGARMFRLMAMTELQNGATATVTLQAGAHPELLPLSDHGGNRPEQSNDLNSRLQGPVPAPKG